jgi:DNA-binding transcriptional LysR family regulator
VWRRDRFAVRSDSDVAQLAFVRAGAGIGICQEALARRSAPALVRVLPQQLQYGLETWVVMHEDLRTSPRCRRTFDALVSGLERYVASVAGPAQAEGPG